MHSITAPHFQLLDYIDLAFSYLSKRVIIKKKMIIFIIKPISSKL